MYQIFFIHSSVDGHLGYFHILAMAKSAAMNIEIHVSFQIILEKIISFFFFLVTETSSCQRQSPLFWGLKLIQVMFLCKKKQIKLLMQIWPQCFKETLGGTNSYFFNFFLCSPLSTLYLFSPLSFNFRVPFPPIELAVKEQL